MAETHRQKPCRMPVNEELRWGSTLRSVSKASGSRDRMDRDILRHPWGFASVARLHYQDRSPACFL